MEQGPDELEGHEGQGSSEAERAANLESATGTPLNEDASGPDEAATDDENEQGTT